MADDLKDVIKQNAQGPESAEADGVRRSEERRVGKECS